MYRRAGDAGRLGPGRLIGNAWGENEISASLPWLCLVGITALILLRFLFTYWKNRLQESIGTERAADQRMELGDMLKRVSLGYFARNNLGDILTALTTELSTLELQSMKMVDAVINGYIQVAVILLCVAIFCPPAALVALVGVLVSAFALRGIGRQSARTAPVGHRAQEALSGAAIEYIHGLPVVKSFGQDGVSVQRFRDACRANKAIRIKNEFGFVPWNCLHLFALRAASVGLVLTAGQQALMGALPLPYFLMIALFSFTIFGSVEAINDAAHVLSVTDSVLDRLEELEHTDFIDKDGREITPERFDVALSHVSFGYGQREVLHDVTFTAPQGTTTAIVGPSGSGKSTICNLVARFYDTDSGTVSVGGHDVREFTCESLLRNISMVFQNVYLFQDSVENNIKFGCPEATHEQVVAAARAACCHDFIVALPDGYDTVIGEGGSTLSGGEKQRISIARAILKDAPIVILDEATASVDPENEHLIQQALSALTKGKTILTIAHRLATIQHADQILVVEDGRIVQRGTHAELMTQGGLYRRFIEIREQAEGWRLACRGGYQSPSIRRRLPGGHSGAPKTERHSALRGCRPAHGGPSPASAMRWPLREGGFLTMDSDYFLHLTDVGREVAEQIYEKHRFFTERLIAAGVDPETAERDACRIEHVISEESFRRLKAVAEQKQ